MAIELTPDGIAYLLSGAASSGDGFKKPIVQVVDIRKVANERFRLLISDGVYMATGMISQAMNARVEKNEVSKFSLLQLSSCAVNEMQGRKIMIIIDFVVLGQAPGSIGTPKWFPGALGMPGMDGGLGGGMGGGPGAGAGMPMGAPMGGSAGHAGGMGMGGGMGSSGVAAAPGMGPMGGAGGGMGTGGGMRPTSIGSAVGGRPAGSMGPTVGAAAPSHFTPIAALTTFNQRWTLKARVVAKSDIRSWNNAKGSGTLFSITLADEGGAEIRGTFFKDAATKWYDRITVGKVYTVTGGKVKMANQAYTSVKNECEITFDDKTVLTEVPDDARIARVVFNFVKLSALEAVEPGKMVDVVGVVTAAPDAATVPSKKNPGEPLTKRDLTLADDSGASITLTLWGDTARSLAVAPGATIALKGVKLGDFGGRSLSSLNSTTIEVNPTDIPEATRIQAWAASLGSTDAVGAAARALTVNGGGGGGLEAPTGALNCLEARIPVKAVKEDAGAGVDGPIHHCRATIGRIKRDDPTKLWYPACPMPVMGGREGRVCNRKMTQEESTGTYTCPAGCPGNNPNFRFILNVTLLDHTGQEFATLFDAEAAQLLKTDANTMQSLCMAAGGEVAGLPEACDKYFRAADWKDVLVTTKAKLEDRNGEQRVKVTVVKVREIDPARESRALIASLKQYVALSGGAPAVGGAGAGAGAGMAPAAGAGGYGGAY